MMIVSRVDTFVTNDVVVVFVVVDAAVSWMITAKIDE
jgi:hypothetical protein